MPEIARELNVDAVVEGAVLRSGDQVRITAQLFTPPRSATSGRKAMSADLQDVLSWQDEVARAIADEVKVNVTPEIRSAGKGPPGQS